MNAAAERANKSALHSRSPESVDIPTAPHPTVDESSTEAVTAATRDLIAEHHATRTARGGER